MTGEEYDLLVEYLVHLEVIDPATPEVQQEDAFEAWAALRHSQVDGGVYYKRVLANAKAWRRSGRGRPRDVG